MVLLMADDMPNQQIANELEVNRRTVLRWWRLYEVHGLDALISSEVNIKPSNLLLVGFLNSLPMQTHSEQWARGLQQALEQFLPDVDRVSIDINFSYSPNSRVIKSRRINEHIHGGVSVISLSRAAETVAESMIQHGFPAHLYHPFHQVEICDPQKRIIGTFVLWRELRNPPTSQETLRFFELHIPFFRYVLTDGIARCAKKMTTMQYYSSLVSEIKLEAKLLPRETEVIQYLLLGMDTDSIASKLCISVHGVRKHITAIHRKTATHSFQDLVHKYMTPLVD